MDEIELIDLDADDGDDATAKLKAYGTWLEDHEGVELRPSLPASNVLSTSTNLARRPSLLVTIGLLAVVGSIGAYLTLGSRDTSTAPSPSSTTSPSPTTEPPSTPTSAVPLANLPMLDDPDLTTLFVAPGAEIAYDVDHAAAHSGEVEDEGPLQLMTVGTKVPGGYEDVNMVYVQSSRPTPWESWSEVDTPTGPALVADRSPRTFLIQQRGEQWLIIHSNSDALQDAVNVLVHVDFDEDGRLELVPTAPMETINREAFDAADLVGAAPTVLVTGTAGDERWRFTIWAMPTEGLPLTAAVADRMTRLELPHLTAGQAWHITTANAEGGEAHGIAWLATPEWRVRVSGQAPFDDVLDLAESLRVVDEDAWRALFPDADIEIGTES